MLKAWFEYHLVLPAL